MEERTCPSCGMRFTPDEKGKCPNCGRHVEPSPDAVSSPEERAPLLVAGEPAPPRAEMPEPPPAPPAPPPISATDESAGPAAAPEPPVPEAGGPHAGTEQPGTPPPEPPAPPAPPMPGPPLADGQFRCPHCGEALYRGEQVCWSCGKRVDEAPEPAPDVPVTEPVTGRPEPAPEPAVLGWEELPRPKEPEPPSPEVMRMAYWSLGLGLASMLTCGALSIVTPIALWLGIKSTREGAGPVGVMGLVLGAMGTLALLVLLVVGALMLIGVAVGGGAGTTEVLAPDGLLDAIVGGVGRCG